MNDSTRTLLRDAMLWARDDAAQNAYERGVPEDDSDRRRNKSERATYAALTSFVDVQRAWIGRVRAELGLPEREGKAVEDAIKTQFAKK